MKLIYSLFIALLLSGCSDTTSYQHKMNTSVADIFELHMKRMDMFAERIRLLERNSHTAEIQQLQVQVADLMEQLKKKNGE